MTSVAETATLVHGFTMADVDRASGIAANLHRTSYWSYDDRYETAWMAIVEHLYANAELPDRDLVRVGNAAISKARNDELRHHGVDRYGEPAAKAERYWRAVAGEEPFADRVTERVALRQALATLTADEYEALVALASLGDQASAYNYLGVSRAQFQRRLRSARQKVNIVWVAPETPRDLSENKGDGCCKYGHPLEGDNLYISSEGRQRCRTCRRRDATAGTRRRMAKRVVEVA